MSTNNAIPQSRVCKMCGKTFPLTAEYFHRSPGNRFGFKLLCKTCKSVNTGHAPHPRRPRVFAQLPLFDAIPIPLTKGHVAFVDPVDADLAAMQWQAIGAPKSYATRCHQRKLIKMHRIILERILGRSLGAGEYCDHIDGDTMNNSRANLRLATNAQNARNSKTRKHNRSGFKGVSRKGKKWCAVIGFNWQSFWLGTFDTPEEAYAAYCAAAIKFHGEFARLK